MIIDRKNYDLTNIEDRKIIMSFAKNNKIGLIPTLSSMLISHCKIFELTEEDDPIARTFMSLRDRFFNIELNYKMITKELDELEHLIFQMFHELLHNVFMDFLRPKVTECTKIAPELTNIILDARINTFLINTFRYQNATRDAQKRTYEFIKANFNTMDSLNGLANVSKIKVDFAFMNHLMPVEELLEIFKPLYDTIKENKKMSNELIEKLKELIDKQQDDHSALEKSIEDFCKATGKSKEEATAMMKTMTRHIIESEKARGTGGSDAERQLFNIVLQEDKSLNFVKVMNAVRHLVKKDTYKTYERIHRHRKYPNGIPYKGTKDLAGKKLIIGIDISGSIQEKELHRFINMIITFMKRNNDGTHIEIIFWSSRAIEEDKDVFSPTTDYKDILKVKPISAGGTVMKFLFDYLEENRKKDQIDLLVLTDGFIDHPALPKNINNFNILVTSTQQIANQLKTIYKDAKISLAKI